MGAALREMVMIEPRLAHVDVLRCRGCRWWEPLEHDPGLGECSRMTASIRRAGDAIDLYPNAGIGVPLLTPELFGCIQFEARES
jgi:hypothetical protein